MKRRKSKKVDLGFILWILSLVLIISLTLYNYHRAVSKNKLLWEEYRRLEMELERTREELEKIRGGER